MLVNKRNTINSFTNGEQTDKVKRGDNMHSIAQPRIAHYH